MKTGLVSVTFRQLGVAEVITLARQAGLMGIEWGGDIHVPTPDAARQTAMKMESSGLETLSYGSYYYAGCEPAGRFTITLETARCLGAPNIRIWAGQVASAAATKEQREQSIRDIRRAAQMAASAGLTVALEYHTDTLTDTQASALQLLEEAGEENLYLYWQPLANTSHTENIANIRQLAKTGKLLNLHVYHWQDGQRLALEAGKTLWEEYLCAAKGAGAALLEFVRDDEPNQLMADAATLKSCLPSADEITEGG